ncbi:hypothetical protein DFR67_10640 [Williamsia limnetica]|uniref:Uncharacterized protein n=1 Tax=Williamsia limnetica TaxID=882452 RepID=A0A318RQ62_WILLI|nr:hypothetical protein DFR67_10640 [Williamsia limnetica]
MVSESIVLIQPNDTDLRDCGSSRQKPGGSNSKILDALAHCLELPILLYRISDDGTEQDSTRPAASSGPPGYE